MYDVVELENKNKKANDILKDISTRYFDIPFGNSKYQMNYLMEKMEVTPERAYRTILLQLNDRIMAVKANIFQLRRINIDMMELEIRMNNTGDEFKFDRMRAEIDYEEKEDALAYTTKLLNDANEEIVYLYGLLQKYPKYTREDFEKGEEDYFTIKMEKQLLGVTDPIAALIAMGKNKFGEFRDDSRFVSLVNKATEKLNELEYQAKKLEVECK